MCVTSLCRLLCHFQQVVDKMENKGVSTALQDGKGGGDGFEVQKFGDGRVALIGKHHMLSQAKAPSAASTPFLSTLGKHMGIHVFTDGETWHVDR